jgi:RecJ-like exonuclease
MVTIVTHADGDGICGAALARMALTRQGHGGDVFFSNPTGFAHDLQQFDDDLVIIDIAIDRKHHGLICSELTRLAHEHQILYIDHHYLYQALPPVVRAVHDTGVSATELVFREYRPDLPEWATYVALLGAISDYLDDTPLMHQLLLAYERRTLFLDAGILAQGLTYNDFHFKRGLVESLASGKLTCENETLVQRAIEQSIHDKHARAEVLRRYTARTHIAFIVDPPASKSKTAHWVMGHSGCPVGICAVHHRTKTTKMDLTLRGNGQVDLRPLVYEVASGLGGTGGGHPNASGARIPAEAFERFLEEVERRIGEALAA